MASAPAGVMNAMDAHLAAAPVGLMSAMDEDFFSDDEEQPGAPRDSGKAQGEAADADDVSVAGTEQLEDERDRPAVRVRKETGLCPELLLGRGFQKNVRLRDNDWIRVGRNKDNKIRIDETQISRHQCAFRWNPDERTVDFKDTSTGGTYVNGELVRNARRSLQHGARIKIQGKSKAWNFLLDLRPVGMATTDPRGPSGASGEDSLSEKRKSLLAKLAKLQVELREKDHQIFDKEKTFFEILSRNKDRESSDALLEKECERYTVEAEEIEQKLETTRDEWKAKLQALYESNAAAASPVVEAVHVVQDKLAKLELKKNELERSIYPERFAMAELPDLQLPLPSSHGPSTHGSQGGASDVESSKRDDVDGEQEAFPTPTPAITPAASLGFAPTPAVDLETATSAPAGQAQPMLAPAELELDPDEIFGEVPDADSLLPPSEVEQQGEKGAALLPPPEPVKRPREEAAEDDDAALLPTKKSRTEDTEEILEQREDEVVEATPGQVPSVGREADSQQTGAEVSNDDAALLPAAKSGGDAADEG
eukprot:TRINITY_DN22441_c0_g1_i1.p1 TRINITY_DN22441_c0_g1~~TRINITY_DN22441_c0_g1_i1.p1  ORF type:complete len:552 (+),score=138.19 TRINITY_DN22441_c0_g1_i1:44-1657(+)